MSQSVSRPYCSENGPKPIPPPAAPQTPVAFADTRRLSMPANSRSVPTSYFATTFPDGWPLLHWMLVGDVAGLAPMLPHQKPSGAAFNASGGPTVTWEEVVTLLCEVSSPRAWGVSPWAV